MLPDNILITLIKNMSVIVTFAYILSKNYTFNHMIGKESQRWKVYLTMWCIPLSIAGTYLSIQIMDALANIRSIGAIVAGIYGGPLVGLAVGIISGYHRWTIGGFTALACAIGVIVSGLIGGFYHTSRKEKNPSTNEAMLLTAGALIIEMGIVILFSRPIAQAFDLVKAIIIPMTLSNMLGVGIFVNILENAREEAEHIKAVQARTALKIANQTLPFLRKGLDFASAKKVVDLIYQETGVDAVAITDREQILAFKGVGSDHHLPGGVIQTSATEQVLETGELVVIKSKDEIDCHHHQCPLRSVVIAPLRYQHQVLGVLKLYRTNPKRITSSDIELASGISSLLSNQMEIARLTEQAQLTIQAELKALQTQINPHFFFNTINTIVSYCRTQPMVARNLLLKLAEFFRYTLQGQGYFCSLQDEVSLVQDYMTIEQARFGDRVQLQIEIPEELLNIRIPRLSLQPLVENAIRHGVSKLAGPGEITISAHTLDVGVEVRVQDNGVGIQPERMLKILDPGQGDHLGIGLSNVHQRLMNLFGQGVQIESQVGVGTVIKFIIPEEMFD